MWVCVEAAGLNPCCCRGALEQDALRSRRSADLQEVNLLLRTPSWESGSGRRESKHPEVLGHDADDLVTLMWSKTAEDSWEEPNHTTSPDSKHHSLRSGFTDVERKNDSEAQRSLTSCHSLLRPVMWPTRWRWLSAVVWWTFQRWSQMFLQLTDCGDKSWLFLLTTTLRKFTFLHFFPFFFLQSEAAVDSPMF